MAIRFYFFVQSDQQELRVFNVCACVGDYRDAAPLQ